MKIKLFILLMFLSLTIKVKAQVEIVSTGTSGAYILNVPAIFPLRNGVQVTFKAHVACTVAPTIDVSTTGVLLIKKEGGTVNLAGGDIKGGQVVTLAYDGFFWQMISSLGNAAVVGSVTGTGTQNYVTKWNNLAGTSIGNSLIFDNGTNVGIGTATPSSQLHLYGAGDPFQVTVENTGGNFKTGYRIKTGLNDWFIGQNGLSAQGFSIRNINNNFVGFSMISSTPAIGIGTASPLAYFHVSADKNATIDSSLVMTQEGNVGIGTVTPTAKLHIAGDNPVAIVNQIAATTSSVQSGIALLRSRGTIASPLAVQANDYLGSFVFLGYDGSGFNQPQAEIGAKAEENYTLTAKGTSMGFSTTSIGSASSLERMIITSGGNVGIGTSTPSTQLHVVGGARITDLAGPGTVIADATGLLSIAIGGAITGGGMVNYIPKWTPTGTSLGNSQIVDDGTNVNISGDNSDNAYKLVVGKNSSFVENVLAFTNTNSIDGAGTAIGFRSLFISTLWDQARISAVTTSGISQGALVFQTMKNRSTNTIIEAMRITGDGNVGIGTTTPSTKLHVVGGARVTGLVGPGTVVADTTGLLSIVAGSTITGSGTTNYLARWTPSGTQLGIGTVQDNGTAVAINAAPTAVDMLFVNRPTDFGANHTAIYANRTGNGTAANGGTSWAPTTVDAVIKGYTNWGNNFTASIAGYNFQDYANSAGVIGADASGGNLGALSFKDANNIQWGLYTAVNASVVGSLGIGLGAGVSPVAKLHVVGDARITGNVGIGTTAPAANAILAINDGHIQSQQTTAPTFTVSANAGTSAAASLTNATDVAGKISLTTGTAGWAVGTQITITYNKPYTTPPVVILTPTNALAAGAFNVKNAFVTSNFTTFFTINFGFAETVSAKIYTWNYYIIETQ